MDLFCEYIVKKKVDFKDILKVFGIILAALILSLVLFFIGSMLTLGVGMALAAAVFYIAFVVSKGVYVEFEYALTNNEMDIDKILGKSRRKRIISVNFKEIELCAAVNDVNFKSQYENKASISKTIDATGISDYDVYFVDFMREGGKVRILFQPTDKMKNGMRSLNPRVIHIL